MKETYDDVKEVVTFLKYHEHTCIICDNLKMVSFLLGQQRGYTKHPCHIRMWNSCDQEKHWIQKDWYIREVLNAGMPNIVRDAVVDRDGIVFSPLHINLA